MIVQPFQVGSLSEYQFFLTAGTLTALLFYARAAGRRGVPQRTVQLHLLLLPLVAGMGARLLYYVQHNLILGDSDEPLFSTGGTGHFGALIAGITLVEVVRRLSGGSAAAVWDSLAIPIAWVVVLGRVACHFGGCCFGTPSHLPWSIVYPGAEAPSPAFLTQAELGLVDAAAPVSLAVHPTQAYIGLASLAIIAVLLWLQRRGQLVGRQMLVMLALHCLVRFGFEFVRGDERGWVGPLHPEHVYSLVALALIGVVWQQSALRAPKLGLAS